MFSITVLSGARSLFYKKNMESREEDEVAGFSNIRTRGYFRLGKG